MAAVQPPIQHHVVASRGFALQTATQEGTSGYIDGPMLLMLAILMEKIIAER